MAKEFEHDVDGERIRVWAETEDEVVAAARREADDRGASIDESEVRDRTRVVPSPRRIKSPPEAVMDERRRRGGERAAEVVEDGMTVGLGTGSTTAWAVAEVGRRLDAGDLSDVRGVATSLQSHELAKELGIPLVGLDEVTSLDVAIDGADQYDPDRPHVVKGGGASHAREKVIDAMADRLVIATDDEKASSPLSHPIPLSVLPDSRSVAREWVEEQGGDPQLRYAEAKDGPLFTANGNLLFDCDFGDVADAEARATELARIPGVQEHGLFVNLVDDVYVGTDDGVETVSF